MSVYESTNRVLKRLDDYPALAGEQVWTRAEIELYINDGFNAFTRATRCILDFFYPENVPQAGNYVAKWELSYFGSGMIAVGLIGFTGGYWERDYAPASSTGPANSNQPWEAEYVEHVFAVSKHPVPEDNVAVDRALHDLHQISPEFTRYFESQARDYQTTQGDAWRFTMDRDGMSSIRFVPAGDGQATTYTVSGTFGLLRSAGNTDGLGTWSPVGTWGVLREIPEHFPTGTPYGIPRRLFSDTNNNRVEYFRLGQDLDELPVRFTKYVEFYAQAKALERDGPGQDLKLSGHFMERFAEGVARMVKRIAENKRPRVSHIGSPSRGSKRTSAGAASLAVRPPDQAGLMAQKFQPVVQEDLNVGVEGAWIAAPGGGELYATQFGLHSMARGQQQYQATWSPGSIAAGSKASTTVTVPDAAVGDFVMASHDKLSTNALRISGHVSVAGTAKVVIHNPTSAAITIASGTVSVLVFPAYEAVVPVTTGTVVVLVRRFILGEYVVYTGADAVVELRTSPGGDLLDTQTSDGSGNATFLNVDPQDVSADKTNVGWSTAADTGTVVAGETLNLTIDEELV